MANEDTSRGGRTEEKKEECKVSAYNEVIKNRTRIVAGFRAGKVVCEDEPRAAAYALGNQILKR